MMSSVIPARLVFQCGHAALVTLPRIKGETSSQRADRVAREKSAAHTRACDFCAQRLEVVVQHTAPASPPAAVPTPVPTSLATPPPTVVPKPVPTTLATRLPKASVPERPAPVPPAPPPVAPVAPPAEPVPLATRRPSPRRNGAPAKKPVGRPRQAATRPASSSQNGRVASGARYTVQFQVQTVLHAADIRDALRQAGSLGAIELLAITREAL